MSATTTDWAAVAAAARDQAMAGMKLHLTRSVEALESLDNDASRAQLVHNAIEASQDWQDAWPWDSRTFGGATAIRLAGGWDSRPGLRRRVLEYRRGAIVATRAPAAAPQSVVTAAAEGAVEGLAEGAGNLAAAAGKAYDVGASAASKVATHVERQFNNVTTAAENVSDTLAKVSGYLPVIVVALVGAVVLGLFLRARG